MQHLIQQHTAERERIRARLYALDQEREILHRREIELGGIIAALDTLAKQQAKQPEPDSPPAKPTARPAGPDEQPAE